ncbi:MAG: hypothetical protein R3B45_09525 [Bdellovibrionota bacterium]
MPWKNLAIFFAVTTAFLLGYACRQNKLEGMSLVSTALASPEMIDLITSEKIEYECQSDYSLSKMYGELNENKTKVIPASVSITNIGPKMFAFCYAKLAQEDKKSR